MKTVCARARAYSNKRAPHPRGRARAGLKQLRPVRISALYSLVSTQRCSHWSSPFCGRYNVMTYVSSSRMS